MKVNHFKYRLPVLAFLVASVFIHNGTTLAQNRSSLSFLADSVKYLWPTNASPYVSATFGETRAAHFHAALDIKTWGQKGYDVYATRDGILHRVGISPNGYGKVIYLKHHDGTYSIYAHLLDFIPQIKNLVDSLRMQNYTFEFDENLEKFNINFQQGEIIGYTGASGVGPPHLHFELRTPDYHPFNPLLTNLGVEDSRPPRFSGLSIEPLSPDALIEGGHRIITKKPVWRNGYFDFGTVNVSGTVGLGIDAFDQANKVSNVYAAYELKLSRGGDVLFHSKIDSFSYNNTHQMFIDRVYPILKKTRQGYQRLFVADGNTLPFYTQIESNGRLRLKKGKHKLTIEAADYYGNISKARVTLNVTQQPTNDTPKYRWTFNAPGQLLALNTPGDTPLLWYNNWVVLPSSQSLYLQEFTSMSFNQIHSEPSAPKVVYLDTYENAYFHFDGGKKFRMHRVTPENRSTIQTPNQLVSLKIPSNAVYDSLSIGLYVEEKKDSVRIDIFPHTAPLREKMRLELVVDTTRISFQNPVVFWHNERKNSLYFQDTKFSGGIVSSKLESFGTHYVINDTVAPDIRNPRLVKDVLGNWELSVFVKDSLSGIDFNKSRFYCNNEQGIAEYDPEKDRIRYYRPEFEPLDENRCRITTYDRAGNESEFSFTISK